MSTPPIVLAFHGAPGNVPEAPVWDRVKNAVTSLEYVLVFVPNDSNIEACLEHHRPDIILLEHGADALARVRAIRQHERISHVAIFLVADHLPLDELPILIESGVDDCLRTGTQEILMRSRISAAARRRMDEQYALIVARDSPVRDSLTGLWNQRHFHELLLLEMRRAQRSGGKVSLLMLDLDRFKRVNDTYGHQAGDLCLREVSLALSSALRAGDIVARYGGEEFAVILPQADRNTAFGICRRIREAVHRRNIPVSSQRTLTVTLSAGVASYPEDALDESGLVHASDIALYQAKRLGRDRIDSVRRHTFRFPAMESLRFVGVSGDWNAWAPEQAPLRRIEDSDRWEGTFLLPTCRNRYKFAIVSANLEGESARWLPDPSNPLSESDGFGGFNSIVEIEPYPTTD